MSVDRGSSSIAWTIQKTAIASLAIVVTLLCSPITAQPTATQTLDTDWLNFKAPFNSVQLGILNEDPVATLQGATFSAADRTGTQIAQGTFTPIPPGFLGIQTFTVAPTGPGPGAVITINIPASFSSCNLDPLLVVTPNTSTGSFPVDQFPRGTFSHFNPSGQRLDCQKRLSNRFLLRGKFSGGGFLAETPGVVYAPPNTSQSSTNLFLDLHNPTLLPQTYTFGFYNPNVGQVENSQQTTIGPHQVVRQPMTFSGFGVPFVCGDGSLVSPNFTIQQTALVGGQTQEQVDQDLESSWRLFLDIANQQLATACPKNP